MRKGRRASGSGTGSGLAADRAVEPLRAAPGRVAPPAGRLRASGMRKGTG